MTRNSPASGRSEKSRCTVCNHPDRDGIDHDLTLGVRSQAEIAELVGVDPSTVSRHYRNHAQPRLAMSMATDTSNIVLGNLIAEHGRLHAIDLEIMARALAAGDLKLCLDASAETRRLLAQITDVEKAIGAGTLRDDDGEPAFGLEAARAGLTRKLNAMRDSYRRMPSILEMVEALEEGRDQEEIDRLMRKASRPPDSPSIEQEEGGVA